DLRGRAMKGCSGWMKGFTPAVRGVLLPIWLAIAAQARPIHAPRLHRTGIGDASHLHRFCISWHTGGKTERHRQTFARHVARIALTDRRCALNRAKSKRRP